MDVIVCAGLAALEFMLGFTLNRPIETRDRTTVLLCLFLAQYLAVKYYRIFLYHRYFSPFRDIPGPTVSTTVTFTESLN